MPGAATGIGSAVRTKRLPPWLKSGLRAWIESSAAGRSCPCLGLRVRRPLSQLHPRPAPDMLPHPRHAHTNTAARPAAAKVRARADATTSSSKWHHILDTPKPPKPPARQPSNARSAPQRRGRRRSLATRDAPPAKTLTDKNSEHVPRAAAAAGPPVSEHPAKRPKLAARPPASSGPPTMPAAPDPHPAPLPDPRASQKRERERALSLPPYSYAERFPRALLLYIRDHEEADRALDGLLAAAAPRVVGFDLEWRPSFTPGSPKHPVALVQIATPETILLLQVSAMKMFPSKLIDFLDDENIIKAGVNILGDCQNLYRDFAVSTRSCVELSYLARCVDGTRWPGAYKQLIGLARLVNAYESRSLPKGKTQLSNWEANLTAIQQQYAANDAHSGFVLCTGLLERARDIELESSYYTFNVISGAALCPDGSPWQRINPNPEPAAAPASAEGVVEAAAQTQTQTPQTYDAPAPGPLVRLFPLLSSAMGMSQIKHVA
ncbi:ribonuclease H-like domain-containing protein [Phellopilus nigrolimitatus]|nr:ribonuclease H-like domain-containing protein [Phellopilus nigrolimitatus]